VQYCLFQSEVGRVLLGEFTMPLHLRRSSPSSLIGAQQVQLQYSFLRLGSTSSTDSMHRQLASALQSGQHHQWVVHGCML
jgi:hypothetical protein